MAERELMVAIQLALAQEGCRLSRNNCGALQNKQGTYVRYGLFNPGGSDLIGWAPNSRFMAVEVKSLKGRLSSEQAYFLNAVTNAGGIAYVARSVQEAVSRFREQFKNIGRIL